LSLSLHHSMSSSVSLHLYVSSSYFFPCLCSSLYLHISISSPSLSPSLLPFHLKSLLPFFLTLDTLSSFQQTIPYSCIPPLPPVLSEYSSYLGSHLALSLFLSLFLSLSLSHILTPSCSFCKRNNLTGRSNLSSFLSHENHPKKKKRKVASSQTRRDQGCQMVYFQTKNTKLGKFRSVFE
jgi:hypothetical protein